MALFAQDHTARGFAVMTLREYLQRHAITQTAFAAAIGTSQAAVNRYCAFRVPEAEVMQAIAHATGGAVTGEDFLRFHDSSCGIGVPDAAGPGDPLVAVPPAAARPAFSCEADQAAAKPNAAARPAFSCEAASFDDEADFFDDEEDAPCIQ
jgi:transcriptional regulator with XRE-family HTH domain